MTMSNLIGFSACPRCQSRGNDRSKNNLAEYTENFYCFACGYNKTKRSISRVNDAFSQTIAANATQLQTVSQLPKVAIDWLSKYQITPEEMKQFRWCEDKQMLLLHYADDYWQGRVFAEGSNFKYLSEGLKPFIKYGTDNDTLVLVEDILSAIKVGRVYSASPMLGTMPLKSHLSYLRPFKNVFLWCDKDAAIKSVRNSRKLSEMTSKPVRPVITDKDPKSFSVNDIKNIISI
jgi:hypothetical protein